MHNFYRPVSYNFNLPYRLQKYLMAITDWKGFFLGMIFLAFGIISPLIFSLEPGCIEREF